MARWSISIEEKIEKQKKAVAKAKVKYDVALEEVNILMKKKQGMKGRWLLDVFMNRDKSLVEIIAFISENSED